MFPVTSIYAGLLALLFIALSFRVIALRKAARVSLGDGGNSELGKRIRIQANCAEYAPIGIVLIALAEAQGAPSIALHLLGLSLLAGRVLHAVAITGSRFRMRVAGMMLTFGALGVAAVGLLLHGLV